MSIKLIELGEVHHVVEIHKSAFSLDFISRTIFSSPKVGCYLSNLIKYPRLQREHFIVGWLEDGNLKGYCHFRVMTNSWHLNYIAVSPSYQQQGIGKKLWFAGMEEGYRRGYRKVTLDVSHTNVQALKWYQQEGLSITEENWIYHKHISKTIDLISHEESGVSLDGWEVAEAWQSLYGFSTFRLGYAQKTWTIGRLGTYFRVQEMMPLLIESVLGLVDPNRKLLFVLPELSQSSDLDFIERSYRMQGDMI